MALTLPRLPVDIATFKRLREENFLYVDKTRQAYNLIRGGFRFFLSRPRRFGKSLLVSMLKELFLGNRKLFQGLWIDQSDYTWKQHGVITLDFSSFGAHTVDTFRADVYRFLEHTAISYELADIVINRTESIGMALRLVVESLHKHFGYVAILIDEYDSPILRSLHNKEQARAMRDTLRDFFSAIKGLDEYINFVFITGVSSFAKAGLFSGMNNLQIMTTEESYADICGYTDEEVANYFAPHIEAWAKKESISSEEQRKQIKDWYNGYRFSSSTTAVYNPFSVMHALHKQRLGNFWFASGTPTFLVEELKKKQHDESAVFKAVIQGESIKASQDSLGAFDIGLTPIPALMFQTGYLTIVDYDKTRDTYRLGYPNHEVRQSLQLYLLSIVTSLNTETTKSMAFKLSTALDERDIAGAVQAIKQLFSHVPYQLYEPKEKYYHALLQMIFTVAGIAAHSEFSTSHGRIDIVVELIDIIYIIEVKLNKPAEEALKQIEKQVYYERFLHKNKAIVLVGIVFHHEAGSFKIEYATRNLSL